MGDEEVPRLKEQIAQLQAEREQTETVFAQLERQFTDITGRHAAVVSDRDKLQASNAALGS